MNLIQKRTDALDLRMLRWIGNAEKAVAAGPRKGFVDPRLVPLYLGTISQYNSIDRLKAKGLIRYYRGAGPFNFGSGYVTTVLGRRHLNVRGWKEAK